MTRDGGTKVWNILAIYAMSIFIYAIIVASVSGTNISNVADIAVEGLVIAESIVAMIIIFEMFKKADGRVKS